MAKLKITAAFCFCLYISDGLVLDGDSSSNLQSRIDALEFLLVEEKQLRIKLETKVNDLVGRITSKESTPEICSCSNQTVTPTHAPIPAFMAGLSTTMDHCSIRQAIVFDSVQINVGSAYSSAYGVFKAPVSGIYAFFVTITTVPNHKFHIAMVKNNSTNPVGLYMFDIGFADFRIRSSTSMVHLHKNDEVWMACFEISQILGDFGPEHNRYDFHSHFSGFLVDEE